MQEMHWGECERILLVLSHCIKLLYVNDKLCVCSHTTGIICFTLAPLFSPIIVCYIMHLDLFKKSHIGVRCSTI